ncbi:hypothetical protein ACIQCQ_32910 [Streptomyces sp. NPDC088394]
MDSPVRRLTAIVIGTGFTGFFFAVLACFSTSRDPQPAWFVDVGRF